jgi:hypothetical protein
MARPASSSAVALGKRNLALGLGAIVIGAAILFTSFWSLAPAFLCGGAVWLGLGFVLRNTALGAEAVNGAWDAASRGRLLEAQGALERASSTYQFGYIRQAIDLCLARIAFRRGDLAAALDRSTAAIDRGVGVLGREYARRNFVNARAVRALVRAAMGDADGARTDAEAVCASADAGPDDLARAQLAGALVLEKTGNRAGLGAHLARHQQLLSEYTTPRERAIVRAYQRLVEVRPKSVYREIAAQDPAPGDEPVLEDWMSKVAPAAAPFVRAMRIAPTSATVAPEAVDPALRNAAAARFIVKPRRRAKWVLVLWVGLIAFFLGVWQFLQPPPGTPRAVTPPPPEGDVAMWPSILAVMVVLVVFALVFRQRTVGNHQALRLLAAARRAATGERDEADRELVALTHSGFPLVVGQAHLMLALSRERRAAFAEALDHCDRGLAAVCANPAARMVGSTMLIPELLSERALLLAASGKDEEAKAEMAHLTDAFPTCPLLARAERRCGVLIRARRGDLAGAADLASQESCDAPLPARDDLLGDVVRIAARGDACSPDEVARVKKELQTNPEARRWIEAVAPAALAAFAAREQSRAHEEDGEAEREALAEVEALAAERVVAPRGDGAAS